MQSVWLCEGKTKKGRLFMKKFLLVLLILAVVTPAMATVTITCTQGATAATKNQITVSFTNDGAQKVRAFALDVNVTAGAICQTGSAALSTGYWVYPGTIDINDTNGHIDNYGSPFCPGTARGAYAGFGTKGVTVEMGSLYVGGPNAPPQNPGGNLFKIVVKNPCNVHIYANATRGGVVMEDGSSAAIADPNFQVPADKYMCTKCKGNLNADTFITAVDITVLVGLLNQAGPPYRIQPTSALWNACADVNGDGVISAPDITAMVGILNQAGAPYRVACSTRCP